VGLVLDTSILIAAERRRFNLPGLYLAHESEPLFIAAITVAELLHGVERAPSGSQRENRSLFVESVISELEIIDFDVPVARRHASLWASLEKAGMLIGPHDLLIAATTLHYDHTLATLNLAEFRQVPNLRLIDPALYSMG
jgi:tRNA(fMet)-specific endonuclease VapC